jgi:4a-hydroxytetrahydrobiopterin dehydratase
VLGEGACTYFRTGSFAAGARPVAAISELPGLDEHHPDVDVRFDGVTVRLITVTPDHYGLTGREVELARRISAVARDLGVPGRRLWSSSVRWTSPVRSRRHAPSRLASP